MKHSYQIQKILNLILNYNQVEQYTVYLKESESEYFSITFILKGNYNPKFFSALESFLDYDIELIDDEQKLIITSLK